MTCPHLDYRSGDDEHTFDHERPYCTVMGEFVSPMQADICNNRFQFSPREHCEIYQSVTELAQADDD